MRSVEEYLSLASEFDRLARDPANAALARRYADLAACYRLLADERKRLIAQRTTRPDATNWVSEPS
jgi:hypothetical protein